MPVKKGVKVIAQNRKARHDYFVDDTYEAGIALCGTEVKSIRAGAVNLKDSYCTIKDGEALCCRNAHQPVREGQYLQPQSPARQKLLMHKKEILRIGGWSTRRDTRLCRSRFIFRDRASRLRSGSAAAKAL